MLFLIILTAAIPIIIITTATTTKIIQNHGGVPDTSIVIKHSLNIPSRARPVRILEVPVCIAHMWMSRVIQYQRYGIAAITVYGLQVPLTPRPLGIHHKKGLATHVTDMGIVMVV